MSRPRTVTKPLDLTALLDGPQTRFDLDATPYAVALAEQEGIIVRVSKRRNATVWKLTQKGRRRARKAMSTT